MHDARTVEGIRQKFLALAPVMDERMRRQWAATEARAFGWGGISAVAEATGLAWNTVKAGLRDLERRATGRKNRSLIVCEGEGADASR